MRLLLVFSQIMLAIVLMLMFLHWAPWIGCDSIEDLKSLSQYKDIEIPKDAQCFYINHGEVGFRNKIPIKDKPIHFIIFTLAMLSCFVSLIVLNRKHVTLEKEVKEKKLTEHK